MRKVLMFGVVLLAMSSMGCKKKVPSDIVQKTLRGALSTHAPATTSAMCGVRVRGMTNSIVTVKQTNADNTGVAHVKGTPFPIAGAGLPPAFCEGDVQFKYTFTSKTSGYKKKTTTTTWYLEHVKLISVQTPGVANATADEDPDGDDE
jgi:hypothetical protein